jgi:predicted Zn-dependent protease
MDEALDQIGKVLEKDPGRVEAHAMAARIYQVLNKPAEANEHLAQIDEKKIDEHSNPALLAQVKTRLGQYDEAAGICNRALTAGNADPALRLILADIYLRQKQYDRAEENLVALVRSQPNLPLAYSLLTSFYIEHKMFDRGRQQFLAFQSMPDMAEPLSRLAQAQLLLASNKPADALLIVEPGFDSQLRARKPLALPLADAMAQINAANKNLPAAMAVYDKLKAAKLFPAQAIMRQADLMRGREPADKTVERLDQAATLLTPEQAHLRYGLMERYAAVNRFDRSLKLIDGWLAEKPNDPLVMRWRGDALARMGRMDDAITAYQAAIKVSSDDIYLRSHLAGAYRAAFDFPAAEKAYLKMTAMPTTYQLVGYAGLVEMYLDLGLKAQAADVAAKLEAMNSTDSRILTVLGESYLKLGKNDLAIQRLGAVPSYAPQYARNQITIARVEQRTGKIEEAKARLQALAKDPAQASAVTNELVDMDLRNNRQEDLLRWSDEQLNTEKLPAPLKIKWLSIRVALAANQRDWKSALTALEGLSGLEPDSRRIAELRAAVLIRLDRKEEAKRLLQRNPDAAKSSLLMAVLGDPAESYASPMASYASAVMKGDLAAARSAAEQVLTFRSILSSDLLPILDRPDAATPEMKQRFQQFGVALVAQDDGLSQLTEELCENLVKQLPTFAPAYGLLVQSRITLEKPIAPLLAEVRRSLPTSALALFLTAQAKLGEKDNAAAVAAFEALVKKEPRNIHLTYDYAQVLQADKQVEKAIAVLTKLSQAEGPYQVAAMNDLAYLTVENHPDQLAKAQSLTQAAMKLQTNYAPLLDTAGWVENLAGHPDAARKDLSRAVGPLKDIPEVQYHMGVVYAAAGNPAWAKYHLAAAADGAAAGE